MNDKLTIGYSEAAMHCKLAGLKVLRIIDIDNKNINFQCGQSYHKDHVKSIQ